MLRSPRVGRIVISLRASHACRQGPARSGRVLEPARRVLCACAAVVVLVLLFVPWHEPRSAEAATVCVGCKTPAITVTFSGSETSSQGFASSATSVGVDHQNYQLTWSETQGFAANGTPATPATVSVSGTETETDTANPLPAPGLNCSGTITAASLTTSPISAEQFQSSSTTTSWLVTAGLPQLVVSGTGDCGSGASTPIDADFGGHDGGQAVPSGDDQEIYDALGPPGATFPSTQPKYSHTYNVNLSGSVTNTVIPPETITNTIVIHSTLTATANTCPTDSSVAAVDPGTSAVASYARARPARLRHTDASEVYAHAAADECTAYVDYLKWGEGTVPVVVDRKNLSSESVDDVSGGSCAPPSADWVRCDQTGSPTKSWPVMIKRGEHLSIEELHLKCSSTCDIQDGTLWGRATLSNEGKLLFKVPHVSVHGAPGLAVDNIVSADKLPDHIAAQHASIAWTITEPGKSTIDAGTTVDVIYETLGPPPNVLGAPFFGGKVVFDNRPFLSVVALASEGATGQTKEDGARAAMYALFQRRDRDGIHRFDLDLGSVDVVVPGAALMFWKPGWSLQAEFQGDYGEQTASCPHDLQPLLSTTIGACNSFEQLFVSMLAVEGIAAVGEPPNLLAGWHAFPGSAVFLVGKWTFPGPPDLKHGTAAYPYVVQFNSTPPTGGFNYSGATGQNNPTPPGFWVDRHVGSFVFAGDHDLVVSGGKIYDPSYGIPVKNTVADWAKAAIAGWAFFTNAVGKPISEGACLKQLASCFMLAHQGA